VNHCHSLKKKTEFLGLRVLYCLCLFIGSALFSLLDWEVEHAFNVSRNGVNEEACTR